MQLLKTIDEINIKDASLSLFRGAFEEQDISMFEKVKFDQNYLEMYGKAVKVPRLEAWYGELDYIYTGMKLKSRPYPTWLNDIQSQVEELTQTKFNSALINMYRDGNDHVSWHSDDEECLGKRPIIASVSFGASRAFQLRHNSFKNEKLSLELEHGDLLLMGAGTQENWKHCVPKRLKVKDPRYNMTFRRIN